MHLDDPKLIKLICIIFTFFSFSSLHFLRWYVSWIEFFNPIFWKEWEKAQVCLLSVEQWKGPELKLSKLHGTFPLRQELCAPGKHSTKLSNNKVEIKSKESVSKCAGNSREAVISVTWIYLSVPHCAKSEIANLTNLKLQIPGVGNPQIPHSV